MARTTAKSAELKDCNCLAVRQAARHVTQFYDRFLAKIGIRTSQFAILEHLRKSGPMTVNALAAELVMDRTTMGRNILPLQRDGLVAVVTDETDRRRRGLILTEAGLSRLTACYPCWSDAQSQFHAAFGARPAAELRHLLRAISASDLNREVAPAAARIKSSAVLTPQEAMRDHLDNPSCPGRRRCVS
jgi:DNA-binding MarR family transcriptional regulator